MGDSGDWPGPGNAKDERPLRVLVAGAGVVGLCIAYRLARAGVEVDVVDRSEPGQGATARSFAWINATYDKEPADYYRLSRAGVESWRRLEKDLEGLRVQWSGSVEWAADSDSAGRLRAGVARHRGWGADVLPLEAEDLRRLEPAVVSEDLVFGCRSPQEASVEPSHVVATLLRACRQLGVRLHTGVEVDEIGVVDDRRLGGCLSVVGVASGAAGAEGVSWSCDHIVLAAGTATGSLVSRLGGHVPLVHSPGVLLATGPVDRDLGHIVLSPDVHFRKTESGAVLAGLDFGGELKGADKYAAGAEILERLRNRLSASRIEAGRARVGFRPMPEDGLPVVGRLPQFPQAYVAVMHSGVTLGPLIGELATEELVGNQRAPLLQPFRPDRFAR